MSVLATLQERSSLPFGYLETDDAIIHQSFSRYQRWASTGYLENKVVKNLPIWGFNRICERICQHDKVKEGRSICLFFHDNLTEALYRHRI